MSSGSWRERTAAAMDCEPKTVQRYQRIYRNIVEGLPNDAERINFHPLCGTFSGVNAIAKRESQAEREKIASVLFDGTAWPSMDAVLDAAGIKPSAGRRDDPSRPDVSFMSALARMKGPRRRNTLLKLADKITHSEVLEMIEVFKRRRIVGDTLRIV